MADEPYWIVVCETRGPAPSPARHKTEKLAITEAKRLALQNPGQVFTVFASVCAVVRNDVLIIPLRPNFPFDDEVPF